MVHEVQARSRTASAPLISTAPTRASCSESTACASAHMCAMASEEPVRRKRTWERRADDARKRHRPSLKDWAKDGFAARRKEDFQRLGRLERGASLTLPRVDGATMTAADFRARYESLSLPCIITNVPSHENWSATQNWTFSQLRHDYGERMFKCGEDDDGYKIKMKLKYFIDYLQHNQDDSPLYIFDSNFYEDAASSAIMRDFRTPSFFPEDLFSLVGEKKRPPYRWFLLGPERSGTTVHLDPLGTSAWNTLLVGRKRWVLIPPHASKRVAKGQDVLKKGEDDEAINYFVDLLPRMRAEHKDLQIIECIQEPGETLFVPGGWWHGVINLEHTIAITQNYCSSLNFDRVWRETREGRKKLAVRWLRELGSVRPDLFSRAKEMNARDSFLMYDERKRLGLVDKKKKKKKKKE